MRSFTIVLLAAAVTACSGSQMPKSSLTRIVVERKTVPAADTIFARMGLETLAQVKELSKPELPKSELSAAPVPVVKDTVVADSYPVVHPVMPPGAVRIPLPSEVKTASLLYHVIVASFPENDINSAEKFAERLKDFAGASPRVITANERARVAFSSWPDIERASGVRDSLVQNSRYKEAWVLKRKL